MCGIAGLYYPSHIPIEEELRRMSAVIRHRGPDADGIYLNEGVGLAHRRLSIIDLSEKANQPMVSASGRYIIVYNGEVYNYLELKKMLNKPLRTTSDTEMIVEGFEKWGTHVVSMLNGMFAFAIFDTHTQVMHLCRDRIGVKPLFYYWDGAHFAFASEIKSLLELTKVQETKSLNKEVVNQFLHLGYIPEPHTIYTHIKKFPTGHTATIQGSHFQLKSYWDVKKKILPKVISDETEAIKKLDTLITDSIKYSLISDVPSGVFLSGGIDSSLVAGVAQSLSNTPINTFSIGFDHKKHDERGYAKAVANHLKTNHHEYIVSTQEAKKWIPRLLDIYDEPFYDTSFVPTLMVSEIARKEVKMILSGDGGDELFMGYGAYKWAQRLHNPLINANKTLIKQLLAHGPSKYKRVAHLFNYTNTSDLKSHIFSQEQYLFSQQEISQLLTPDYKEQVLIEASYKDLARELSPHEIQALFDIEYYLKDDLLTKVDRASMHHSLEVRVPLLDHFIVEFAINLDARLKLKGNTHKYLLKQVLYNYVPKTYFERPKWGFSIPLDQWLSTDLRFLIDDYLSEENILKVGVVDPTIVKSLIARYLSKKEDYLYNRIWLLIVLHKFMLEKMH